MAFLRDLSIRRKLLLTFGIIILLSAAVGFTALTLNAGIRTNVSQIRQAALENSEGVNLMAESLLTLSLHPQAGAAADVAAQFERGLALCRKDTAQHLKEDQRDNEVSDAANDREELQLLDRIAASFTTLQGDLRAPQAMAAASTNDYGQLNALVKDYSARTKQQLARDAADIDTALARADAILLAFVVVILAASLFLAYGIFQTVSRPITTLKAFAERIGRGDLDATVEIRSRDEFGLLARTFDQMIRDLRAKTVSRDYVESILKSMANTLIVMGLDRKIQSANAAALDLLGYGADDLIGQPVDLILEASDQRPVLDEALAQGFLSNVDLHYKTRRGERIPMTFTASTLQDGTGAVTGLVCVAQDISERKQSERELEEANVRLLDASRRAGMAEVATSVLHNVGNVLNSVNVSSALISEKVENSKLPNLGRALALMEAHAHDLPGFFGNDPKGKQLPDYLSKLAANLTHEQEEIVHEIRSLLGSVHHIKEVVAVQQNYARVTRLPEPVNVRELVEDALRLNREAIEQSHIRIVRDYAATPGLLVEKHKVLQILVNLLRNAKHACNDAGGDNREIVVRVSSEGGRIRIAVSDNGVGILPENLTRIFSHGFTTRKEGHGFGLHSGALAAREMEGTLAAFSEGPGHGATFTLDLPIQPKHDEHQSA